jgi:DNA-binding PadR family transcriptional regulator
MTESAEPKGPLDFLPLTPVAFEVLLSLGDGERHGYAIMRRVEERTNGGTSLHPGTLYRALGRLVDTGLLREIDRASDDEDERRRYYTMTGLGRRVAAAESERLASQLEAARTARLFNPGTES